MTGASNIDGHLGQRLVFEDRLPLSCEIIDTLPAGNTYTALQIDNEEVLHAVMLLEDVPRETPEDNSAEGQDMLRLEYKINLMFELLSGLYQRDAKLPEPVELILRSDALTWQSQQQLDLGSLVRVHLYLSRKYPKPLVLHGKVVTRDEAPGERTTVIFDDAVSERCRDWIDKFIFRHHRRAVALARQQT